MTTITEALAEVKTVGKRIATKREFISKYAARPETMKDPLEKDGGAPSVLAKEMQAIRDLETRIIEIRRGIQSANETTKITVEGVERSIADWLIWRREVSDGRQRFLNNMRMTLTSLRDQLRKQPTRYGNSNEEVKPLDYVVHLNEKELAEEYEKNELILGGLDGQLSLKNATTNI